MSNQIFSVKKTCPICHTVVEVYRVKSSSYSLIGRDSDFCPQYSGINPLLYQVAVCPQCHYAAPSKTFGTDHPSEEKERLKTLLPILKAKDPEFKFEPNWTYAAMAFELLIRTMQICKKPPHKLAPLFLRTAWCYRFLGNQEKEIFFLELACKHYEENYLNSYTQNEMSEVRQLYLIGELKRRLGKFDEAIFWFSKVVSHPQIKNEPEVERLAREQWYITKEQKQEKDNKNSAQQQANGNIMPKEINLNIKLYENQYIWLKSFLQEIPLPPHQAISEFLSFLITRLQKSENLKDIYDEFKNTLSSF
ncbi:MULTISPECIES: DUF2225 domain-containing protein [Carboxydocella]|uniref:DUF2225 domain-containing protein n=2 Tax=Carboxydocella TaxID=178898 RepID=A0A1T4LNX4_9FIRM|nr:MULTISPECIES: DUF2225 domain-containing protein [Carboxydocella]AVX20539.1 hypothetical protein CFE_1350 [Carboxydocella thermautotrophica]AVX30961.1 hypothetical protein CTH_1371 [Carboxydocella thermautotrophica]SJZ56337.1 hypothetical protein SAMN02745885_00229 [Carboxydocella sporoproducens DSM 16521]GAW29643.1 hypothetical protein ULO1_22130 [Carboxydocella sp. ULO1]GAW31465.1 hypothetical protein JDF658_12300 [Carboxydocella sp. JDF658]